jgi:hypothetical protein
VVQEAVARQGTYKVENGIRGAGAYRVKRKVGGGDPLVNVRVGVGVEE